MASTMNHEKQFPHSRRQQLSALAIEALHADARTRRRSSNTARGPLQPRRSVSMRSLFSRSTSERKLSPTGKVKYYQDSSLDLNNHSNRLCRSRSLRHVVSSNRASANSAAAAARSNSPSRHVSETDSNNSAYGTARDMYKTVKDCLQEDEWFENLLGSSTVSASADTKPRRTYAGARQRSLQREMQEVQRLLQPPSREDIPATPVPAAKATLQLQELADQQESPTGVMDLLLNEVADISLGEKKKRKKRSSTTSPKGRR